MATLFEQVQKYHDLGFSIIPQEFKKKKEGKISKLPPRGFGWKKYQTERVTKTDLITKWRKYFVDEPGRGVAILTGPLSNLLVVDIDDKKAEDIVKEYLPENFKTVTIKTGSGGWHLWFKYREGLRSTAGLGDSGLDIRAEGGYVAAPPSRFPDPPGGQYNFAEGLGIGEVEIAHIPEGLFSHLQELINEYSTTSKQIDKAGKKSDVGDWFETVMSQGSKDGVRTNDCVKMVGYLFRQNISPNIIISIMNGWNRLNSPPLPQHEIEFQIKSTLKNIGFGRHEDLVEKMNKRFGVVNIESSVTVIRKYKGHDGSEQIGFIKPIDLKTLYANQNILINKKPENIIKLWMEHPDRKTYKGVIFEPSLEPDETENGFFNFWSGFDFEPKKGTWTKFRWHIENIIAPGNSEWVLAWMARIIQDPGGNRPGTVLCLRGGHGSGKSFFCENFGRLFGKHFFTIDSMDDITSEFNHYLKDTIFLSIDDATWGGDKKHAGKLRSMVTSEYRKTQPKFVDAFQIKNHLNIVISSNLDWMIPAGLQERRFLILDVSEEKLRNVEYFQAMKEELDKGGYEAMMNDLLAMDISDFNLREIPKTAGTRDNSVGSLGITESFWLHRLENGTLVDAHKFWKQVVIKQKLYEQYEDFCRSRGRAQAILGFGPFLSVMKKLCPPIETKRLRCCPHSRERFYVYTVPNLEDCRGFFDKAIGITGEWERIIDDHSGKIMEDSPGTFRDISNLA